MIKPKKKPKPAARPFTMSAMSSSLCNTQVTGSVGLTRGSAHRSQGRTG